MSYLVLARKWRPQRFADLTGQDVVVRTLKNALISDKLAHAYLMTGIRGVGKTTISRLMAMAVNCTVAQDGEPCGTCDACTSIAQGNNLDVLEMDAASHTGVDDIREILDGVRYPAVHLKIKVYIIDEAHMLSKSAFNALLKTLEEPPERVLFILATTESDKLPITVRSRCQRFDLRRLDVDEISVYLQHILQEEGITAAEDALQVIARAADGSVRDALSLTERVLAFSDSNISLDDVQQSLGLIGSAQTEQLANVVLAGDAKAAVQSLRQARELGVSPAHLLLSLSECLHQMMCCKLDESLIPQGVSEASKTWLLQHAKAWNEQALDMRYQVLLHGLRDIALLDEQRGAEMIVMRLAHLNSISPADSTVEIPTIVEKKTLKNEPPQAVVAATMQSKEVVASSAESVQTIASETAEPQSIEPQAIESEIIKSQVMPPQVEEEAEAETVAVPEGKTAQTWAEAMALYHQVKAGVAAMLEHVYCASFADKVELHLDTHQLESLDKETRQHFQTWLQREVVWLQRSEESGESLLQQQKRAQDTDQRQLWQQAEADPNVQAVQAAFDCRITQVRAPETD
ncbi:MAG: DNA polymerase III subunit gamma/tau [Mariprofundaceae bacterium]|nr:DNA polymerase III subunit gamma/tau [Mariprofundaceae bacterium]